MEQLVIARREWHFPCEFLSTSILSAEISLRVRMNLTIAKLVL